MNSFMIKSKESKRTADRFILLIFNVLTVLIAIPFNSYHVLALSCVLSLAITSYIIFSLFEQAQAYRFYLLAALSCGFWVTLAFLQSAYRLAKFGIRNFASVFTGPFFSSVDIEVSDYALALAYLYIFIIAAAIISEYHAFRSIELRFYQFFTTSIARIDSTLIRMSTTMLSAFLIATSFLNIFGVRGLANNNQVAGDPSLLQVLPWWFPVYALLFSVLPFLIAQCLLRHRTLLSVNSVVILLAISSGIYFNLLFGRRAVLIFLVTMIYSVLLFRKPSDLLRRLGAVRLMFLALLAPVVLSLLELVFSFLNIIRNLQGTAINPVILLTEFNDFLASRRLLEAAAERQELNLLARPLVLWPLAAAIKMSNLGMNNGYLYFKDLLHSFLWALPGPLFPYKQYFPRQEALLYSYFPFSSVDTADSPHLYSYASFGLFGILIYPIFIASIYILLLSLVNALSRLGSAFPFAIITLPQLISFAGWSYGETSMTSLIRDLFVLPLSFVILAIPLSRLMRPDYLFLVQQQKLAGTRRNRPSD